MVKVPPASRPSTVCRHGLSCRRWRCRSISARLSSALRRTGTTRPRSLEQQHLRRHSRVNDVGTVDRSVDSREAFSASVAAFTKNDMKPRRTPLCDFSNRSLYFERSAMTSVMSTSLKGQHRHVRLSFNQTLCHSGTNAGHRNALLDASPAANTGAAAMVQQPWQVQRPEQISWLQQRQPRLPWLHGHLYRCL